MSSTCAPLYCGAARAFTIIEVAIVIVVVSLLAATAIPAMDSLTQTRRISAVREIERRLGVARATAVTSGRPTGLAVDFADDTLLYVHIAAVGAAPSPVTTPSGEPDEPFSLAAEFPGVEITDLVSGDPNADETTFWFSFEGVPQIRSETGLLLGGFTQDALIELTGGGQVHIRRISGLIER